MELWSHRRREIIVVFLFVLVGLASFGWGYRLGAAGKGTPIIIEMREEM